MDSSPAESVEVSKDELVSMFELMYTMRRMEITCDNEYKARAIRGANGIQRLKCRFRHGAGGKRNAGVSEVTTVHGLIGRGW